MKLQVLFCLVGLVLAGACMPKQAPAVCRLDVDLDLYPPWQPVPSDFDLAAWGSLLLRGADRDCTGLALTQPEEGASALRPHRLTLAQVDAKTWLVWLQTHRLASGATRGPLAKVRAGQADVLVVALGQLTAPDGPVELAQIQVGASQVLKAVSGRCATDHVDQACWQHVQLFVERGGQWHTSTAGGITLLRRLVEPRAQGRTRVTTLRAELTPATAPPGEVRFDVSEQLTVQHLLRADVIDASAIARQSEARRVLTFAETTWTSSAKSLWERMDRR